MGVSGEQGIQDGAMTLSSRAAPTSPKLCPDWVEHFAKKVTWLPKPPLDPQEVAVCLGGSAMVLDSTGGKKTLNNQGKVTLFGG